MSNRRLDHSWGSAANSAAHVAREAASATVLVGMMLAGIVIVLAVPPRHRLPPR